MKRASRGANQDVWASPLAIRIFYQSALVGASSANVEEVERRRMRERSKVSQMSWVCHILRDTPKKELMQRTVPSSVM